MQLNIETYTLPAHWASALVNADTSGMEDDEEQALNDWMDHHQPGVCLSCSEVPEFRKFHDAAPSVLACDCLDFDFTVYP